MLKEQNIEASVGALGESSKNVFQYTLRYTGRKTEVAQFENMVIKTLADGEELRLKDVAGVELGQSEYNFTNTINSHPGTMAMITQVAGSNATQINNQIDELFDGLKRRYPRTLKLSLLRIQMIFFLPRSMKSWSL